MLDSMRNIKGSWVMKILLTLLAVTFISFYGLSQHQGCNSDLAASVNGQPLSLRELQRNYHFRLKQFSASNAFKGSEATPEFQKMVLITTLQEMINASLLLQQAQKSGVLVSSKEAAELIKKQFRDPQTGKFDPQQYEMIVPRWIGMPTQDYERLLLQELTANRFQGLLRALPYTSEKEAQEQFIQNSEQLNLQFIPLSQENFKHPPAAPAEAELRKFFDGNREMFKAPEKRKFLYLALSPKGAGPDTAKNEKERQSLTQERQAEIKKALDQAKKIYQQAKGSGDFRKFAAGAVWNGQPLQVKEGGPLTENNRLEEGDSFQLVRQAFKLKKAGDTSEPLEGWSGNIYLVRLSEIIPSQIPPFEQVRSEVAKRWQERRADQALAEEAARLLAQLRKAKDPLAAAKALKLPVQETGLFKRSSSGLVPKIGSSQELTDLAFALEKDGAFPAQAVAVERKQLIFWLKHKEPADLAKWEKMKEELVETARQEKAERLFGTWLEQLRERERAAIVIHHQQIAQAFPDLFPNDV